MPTNCCRISHRHSVQVSPASTGIICNYRYYQLLLLWVFRSDRSIRQINMYSMLLCPGWRHKLVAFISWYNKTNIDCWPQSTLDRGQYCTTSGHHFSVALGTGQYLYNDDNDDDDRAIIQWSGDSGSERWRRLCDFILSATFDDDVASVGIFYQLWEKFTIVGGNILFHYSFIHFFNYSITQLFSLYTVSQKMPKYYWFYLL